MKFFQVLNSLGQNYYRLDVKSTRGYHCGDFGNIAAAPVIHTYSPHLLSASTRLALFRQSTPIQFKGKPYRVKRYLTVQCLNQDFITDEDPQGFRPTVKPHYAIAPINRRGTVYNKACKMLLVDNDGVVDNQSRNVHAHDGKVSPVENNPVLRQKLMAAARTSKSFFLNSYVVDEVNQDILITQHCLLNEDDFSTLFLYLDSQEQPTFEGLTRQKTAIRDQLVAFNSDQLEVQPFMDAVFSGKRPSVSLLIPREPSSTDRLLETERGAASVSSTMDTLSYSQSGPYLEHKEHEPQAERIWAQNPSFWLKALAVSAIAVGFIALTACTLGIGVAIAGGAAAAATGYAVGAIGSSAFIAGSFWGLKKLQESEPEERAMQYHSL